MLIKCYECEAQMSDAAGACPHCGAPSKAVKAEPVQVQVVPEQKKSSNWGWWVGGAVGAFVLWLVVGNAMYDPNSPASRAQAAKEECQRTSQAANVGVNCDDIAKRVKSDLESPGAAGVTQADIDAALADGAQKAERARNKPTKPPVYPKP